MSRRKTGRPPANETGLSREVILDTALRLIDEGGIDALSMRRLAAVLGVDPMAIYHYLPNKQALLSGVVERVFAHIPLPESTGQSWEDEVRACAHAYYNTILAHPQLAFHVLTDIRLIAQVAWSVNNERLYAALFAAGLDTQQVFDAASVIVDYLHGYALGMVQGGGQPPQPPDEAERERFPLTHQVIESAQVDADLLDRGLSIILAGIRRR